MNSNDKNRNISLNAPGPTARSRMHSKNPDSKTFNEDESSYNRKLNEAKNDLNKNTSYSFTDNYSEEERWGADYINSDHSDYNRTNSRFYWDDYDV